MCKNNFTNENEFDFCGFIPPFGYNSDSVCNPSGPLGGTINIYGDTIIINN